MQTWPATLDNDRIEALSAVDLARVHVSSATGDDRRAHEAGVRARVACRLCLRMLAAASTGWPEGRRLSGRMRALCELIEQHAQAGIVLSDATRGGAAEDRRLVLVDLLAVLADLGFYLDVLGRDWPGEI